MRTPEQKARRAETDRKRLDAQRAALARKRDRDPEIPGLIPIWARGHRIIDFARVDLADWERLRYRRLNLTGTGYVITYDGRRQVYLHHLIVGRLTRHDHVETDHINRDRLDNRRANLRLVTHKENCANRGGIFARAA